MRDRFAAVMRRALRYDFQDGTTELMMGLAFFCAGLLFKPLPLPVIPNGIPFLGLFLTFVMVEWVKQRYVYPRSGYVNTNRTPRVAAILVVCLIAVAAIFVPFFLGWRGPDAGFSWLPLSLGAFLGCTFLWQGFRLGYPRLIVVAAISIGLGAALSPLFVRGQTFYFSSPQIPYWVIPAFQILLPAYFLLIALVLVSSGGLAFLRYLRDNPAPAEVPDEH